ncbi:hypothetical protein BH10PAT3_BH10PAT3_8890 [soil metagenome]
MLQLNLLPDVKIQFIRAKRAKRMVIVFAVLAVGASLALLFIMFSLTMLQKRHISQLNKDINTYEKALKNTPDLAKILTIQNQLNSLPDLYSQRPVVSRLFPYVEQTTPASIGIAHLIVDFADSSINIEGTSDTLESVNRYVDTLKFTKYKMEDSETTTKAFTNVVLGAFGRDSLSATYGIKLNFNPDIFDASKKVTLVVPETISTRSETELPGGVFNTEKAK